MALRRRGEIFALMDLALKKPIPPRPHLARAILQIGLVQLRFLETADHAAIHETVNACGRAEQPYRGLIHAVLRRIQRETPPTQAEDNIPQWLRERWQSHYGAAVSAQICAVLLTRPPLDLCFAKPEDADQWGAAHGDETEATRLSPHAVRLAAAGRVEELPDFATGTWWVQDIGAQIAATGFSEIGETLDLCAAPGGKTLQLLAAGHDVTAVDLSASRLTRLRDNLARCRQSAQLVEADILNWTPDRRWPRVLLDAPCTATGTLRRHPDIAIHRRPDDIAERQHLQKDLLDRAMALCAPGGELIYCVCSLEPEEGEAQAREFTARYPHMQPMPYRPDEPALSSFSDFASTITSAITPDGGLRLTPNMLVGGMDGFFVARWKHIPPQER